MISGEFVEAHALTCQWMLNIALNRRSLSQKTGALISSNKLKPVGLHLAHPTIPIFPLSVQHGPENVEITVLLR